MLCFPRTSTMGLREVERVATASERMESIGVHVRRSVGDDYTVDPFLILDEFETEQPAGFPHRPHRGIQIVTYVMSGSMEYSDNKGHEQILTPGDLQWLNAGRGIVHSETPGPHLENTGVQLWVNLPSSEKMSEPGYQELGASEIPEAEGPDGGTKIKVIAGECFGVQSEIETATPILFLDIGMEPCTELESLEIPEEYNAFVYVLEGRVRIGSYFEESSHGDCIVLSDGEAMAATTGYDGARFLLIAGEPIGERVVQHGPFVMNSRQEIQQAINDYENGDF